MLSSRRYMPWTVLLLLAVVLAGCAGGRHAPAAVGDARGKGLYKIGNPYQIDGVWYYPAEDWNYNETGIASWYGEAFHGKDTANGENFDLNAMTAAHRTLPLPTVVEVTNLDNGRSIQVRVNDRGPFARGRIIDLSRRSAQLLGFEAQGTAKVRVKILVPESIQAASLARRRGAADAAIAAAGRGTGIGAGGAIRQRRSAAAASRPDRRRPGQAVTDLYPGRRLQPLRQRDEREEPDRAVRHGQGDRGAQSGHRHVPRTTWTDPNGRGSRSAALAS